MTVYECVQELRAHDDYLILTHTRPDGDTLGSAGALCSALRRMGKTARLFPNPEITERYRAMVEPFVEQDRSAGYVISVDVAGEEMFPKGFEGKADLAIDHHSGNPGFARQTVLKAGKASCGEIVLEVLEGLCGAPTPEEASLLYTAVSTDCGCFVYGNTRADTHRAAAYLIDCGADHHRLNKELFRSDSYARLKLEGLVFSSLRSLRNHALNVAVISLDMMEESGATEDDCDDLAALPGRIRGNRVSVTVRELSEGKSKASVRTDGTVDAGAVCARFGGGGHFMAAGCTAALPPEELAAQVTDAIASLWPE